MDKVSKSFDGFKAIENICLSIQKGSIYGLIGSNGAGKTTLIKILAGVYLEDQGSATIDDEPIFENSSSKRENLLYSGSALFFTALYSKANGCILSKHLSSMESGTV